MWKELIKFFTFLFVLIVYLIFINIRLDDKQLEHLEMLKEDINTKIDCIDKYNLFLKKEYKNPQNITMEQKCQ